MRDRDAVKVERGSADAAELAALTVALLSRLRTGDGLSGEYVPHPAAGWRRWERAAAYRAPHSWQ
ncbi:acyl-CoA carboxylase epsilon subunit [Streptomyces sp. NPDC004134]|uniref:acyl-CoA carboxylase epsilon subunit n=1 Tax=Streptomyces sp. NPDC004134 TaxID=3364691 RepID=UPI0036C745EA